MVSSWFRPVRQTCKSRLARRTCDGARQARHASRPGRLWRNAPVRSTKSPRLRRIAAKARLQRSPPGGGKGERGARVAYRMIAERENEKLNVERESRLLIVAKAKIFSSEGWKVVV